MIDKRVIVDLRRKDVDRLTVDNQLVVFMFDRALETSMGGIIFGQIDLKRMNPK
jgi:hypothetical protein